MSIFHASLVQAVKTAGDKPSDDAAQGDKKNWSERVSNNLALAIAEELRRRGMKEARPAGPGEVGTSGAERRLAGGIGAKNVDVTWATEESGLILACSVKTIMFKDRSTRNYQKNLTNRRGDLLIEAVTLHRRFPYAVITGFLLLDAGAETDNIPAPDSTRRVTRRSTFQNAFPRLRLFTGRTDPAGRDEQFERLFLLLVDSNRFQPALRAYEVNDDSREVDLDSALDAIVELVGERNFDLYDGTGGIIRKT